MMPSLSPSRFVLAVFLLLTLAGVPASFAAPEAAGESAGSDGARILVFVDDVFSIESRRDAVLRRLAKQLDELGPRDAMAVVAWDGERDDEELTILSGWTGDRARLAAALEKARERPARGLLRRSEWARLESLEGDRRRSFGGTSFSSIGFQGSRRDLRPGERPTRRVVDHLGRLVSTSASALASLRPDAGDPALLFLSGGLPPATEPADMDPLVESARRLGWTVYPVDLGAALAMDVPDPDPSGVLASVAERTGGAAYLDGRRFTALRRALDHLAKARP